MKNGKHRDDNLRYIHFRTTLLLCVSCSMCTHTHIRDFLRFVWIFDTRTLNETFYLLQNASMSLWIIIQCTKQRHSSEKWKGEREREIWWWKKKLLISPTNIVYWHRIICIRRQHFTYYCHRQPSQDGLM